jgi:ABC-type amino acid transport system permease subunit
VIALALLLMVRVPAEAPAVFGSNVTCNVSEDPGFNDTGKVLPDTAKPVPETPAPFTVTGPVPADLSVMVSVAVLFTVTLPKLRLVALVVSRGTSVATPVPLRLTVIALALLPMVRVPAEAPAVFGSNVTCNVSDTPGFNVTGNVLPDTVYPVPETPAPFTLTGAVPEDLSVMVSVAVLFTVTLPKLRLVALAVS